MHFAITGQVPRPTWEVGRTNPSRVGNFTSEASSTENVAFIPPRIIHNWILQHVEKAWTKLVTALCSEFIPQQQSIIWLHSIAKKQLAHMSSSWKLLPSYHISFNSSDLKYWINQSLRLAEPIPILTSLSHCPPGKGKIWRKFKNLNAASNVVQWISRYGEHKRDVGF